MNSANLDNIQQWGQSLRLLVELAGTAAFALSGVLEAAQKRLDAVGVCVAGGLSAQTPAGDPAGLIQVSA